MDSYTIYASPSDYPGQYVVRRWVIEGTKITPDPEPLIVTQNVGEARRKILEQDPGLVCFGHDFESDPAILETWL